MTIDVEQREGVCILSLSGELSFGEPTGLLRQKSRELIAGGERLLLLDMLSVPWLDSSGIGEIVACYKRAREQKGVVKLVLGPKSRSLFTLTQLEKMFEIFDDRDSALASFAGPDGGYRERF